MTDNKKAAAVAQPTTAVVSEIHRDTAKRVGALFQKDGTIIFDNRTWCRYVEARLALTLAAESAAPPAAPVAQPSAEPVAWAIEFTPKKASKTERAIFFHNAIGDYRHFDPNAKSTPLYDHPAGAGEPTEPSAEPTVICQNCQRAQVASDYDAATGMCIDCFPQPETDQPNKASK